MATGAWKLDESDVVGIKRLIKQGMKDGDIERYDVSREHIGRLDTMKDGLGWNPKNTDQNVVMTSVILEPTQKTNLSNELK